MWGEKHKLQSLRDSQRSFLKYPNRFFFGSRENGRFEYQSGTQFWTRGIFTKNQPGYIDYGDVMLETVYDDDTF